MSVSQELITTLFTERDKMIKADDALSGMKTEF